MSDTVKSWIEERRAVIDGEVRWFTKIGDAHKALDALNAVLELHEPINGFVGDPSHWECNVCGDERGPKPYPCPTVRAIEEAISDE